MMRKGNLWVISMMTAGWFAAVGSAQTQLQGQPANQAGQSETAAKRTRILNEMNQVQERARAVQAELDTIAQTAMQQNPELMQQQNALMDLYREKLDAYGYPSEQEMQKLQEMQNRLQTAGANGLDEEARQQLTQQFNAEVAKLQATQAKARNDPQVVAAQKTFEETRAKAMREVDAKAPELQAELGAIQGKLTEFREELQKVLQTR